MGLKGIAGKVEAGKLINSFYMCTEINISSRDLPVKSVVARLTPPLILHCASEAPGGRCSP